MAVNLNNDLAISRVPLAAATKDFHESDATYFNRNPNLHNTFRIKLYLTFALNFCRAKILFVFVLGSRKLLNLL